MRDGTVISHTLMGLVPDVCFLGKGYLVIFPIFLVLAEYKDENIFMR